MSNEERLANNQKLVERFQTLQADPNTTAEAWSALGMDYFVAGYILNAGACFNREDAARSELEKSKLIGKSVVECVSEVV